MHTYTNEKVARTEFLSDSSVVQINHFQDAHNAPHMEPFVWPNNTQWHNIPYMYKGFKTKNCSARTAIISNCCSRLPHIKYVYMDLLMLIKMFDSHNCFRVALEPKLHHKSADKRKQQMFLRWCDIILANCQKSGNNLRRCRHVIWSKIVLHCNEGLVNLIMRICSSKWAETQS